MLPVYKGSFRDLFKKIYYAIITKITLLVEKYTEASRLQLVQVNLTTFVTSSAYRSSTAH